MLLAKGKIKKVVVIRPGALGDVLAVRGTIRFIKDAFPGAEVCLLAPGERGRFFQREGWADRVFDWDRAVFSWLFSQSLSTNCGSSCQTTQYGATRRSLSTGSQSYAPPPPALAAIFSGCDWVLAYIDGDATLVEARLNDLAPAAGKLFCPSRPPAGHEEGIGQWLARAAVAFCRRFGLSDSREEMDLDALASARFVMEDGAGRAFSSDAPAAPYFVLHPGSGDRAKNWPLANFLALGGELARAGTGEDGGEPLFAGAAVVSGEADGDLGFRLAEGLPGAVHLHRPDLAALAATLAHARLYVGNDSGVTHLAASVATAAGTRPRVAAIFGPSDDRVWVPPGALALRAGPDMDALSPEAALAAMKKAGLLQVEFSR